MSRLTFQENTFNLLSTILILLYYNVAFLLHRKKFIRRHRKIFESLGGHRSTNDQKFFGKHPKISFVGLICAKKGGHLRENLAIFVRALRSLVQS